MMKFLIIVVALLLFSAVRSFNRPNDYKSLKTKLFLQSSNDKNVIKLDVNRFIKYNSIAFVLAIGANFLGITSAIMSNTNPSYFRSLKLDKLYSINGYQRYVDDDNNGGHNYEFIYPSEWSIDRSILVAREIKRETPEMLLSTKTSNNNNKIRPDVAFTDLKSKGKINVSILKSIVLPGFSLLNTLGTPIDAAPELLSLIAPENSGKTYTLIRAEKNRDPTGLTSPSYLLEYNIKNNYNLNQHCISIISYKQYTNSLYTLTAMAPESEWDSNKEKVNTIAASFTLL